MLPAWVWPVLDLWAACRVPGPMGAPLHLLPGPGGAGCQPAALMTAFGHIDRLMAQRVAG